MQVRGNSYMGDVSRMRLLRDGAELPGIICTADRFGLGWVATDGSGATGSNTAMVPRITRDTPCAVARRKTSGNSLKKNNKCMELKFYFKNKILKYTYWGLISKVFQVHKDSYVE